MYKKSIFIIVFILTVNVVFAHQGNELLQAYNNFESTHYQSDSLYKKLKLFVSTTHDSDFLENIVLEYSFPKKHDNIQFIALLNIDNIAIVREALLRRDLSTYVKQNFISQFDDPKYIAQVLSNLNNTSERPGKIFYKAVQKIKDPKLLDQIIRSETHRSIKHKAITVLKDQKYLFNLLKDGVSEDSWTIANNLNDKEFLRAAAKLPISVKTKEKILQNLGNQDLAYEFYQKVRQKDDQYKFGYFIHTIKDKEKLTEIINTSPIIFDRVKAIEAYYGYHKVAIPREEFINSVTSKKHLKILKKYYKNRSRATKELKLIKAKLKMPFWQKLLILLVLLLYPAFKIVRKKQNRTDNEFDEMYGEINKELDDPESAIKPVQKKTSDQKNKITIKIPEIDENKEVVQASEKLAKTVTTTKSKDIARQAFEKIESQKVLLKIVQNNYFHIDYYDYQDLQEQALERINALSLLYKIAIENTVWGVQAIAKIEDQKILTQIAILGYIEENQIAAVKKVSSKYLLNRIHREVDGNYRSVRAQVKQQLNTDDKQYSIRKIKDPQKLLDIAKNDKEAALREIAIQQLPETAPYNITFQDIPDESRPQLIHLLHKYTNYWSLTYLNNCLKNNKPIQIGLKAQINIENEIQNSSIKYRLEKIPFYRTLKSIALNDASPEVRIAALKKINNSDFLFEIALKDTSEVVRRAALEEVADDEKLLQIIEQEEDSFLKQRAIEKLSFETNFQDLYYKESDSWVKKKIIERIGYVIYKNKNSTEDLIEIINFLYKISGSNDGLTVQEKARSVIREKIDIIDDRSSLMKIGKIAEKNKDFKTQEKLIDKLHLAGGSKTCRNCNTKISIFSQVGESCKHCGVTWGQDKQEYN